VKSLRGVDDEAAASGSYESKYLELWPHSNTGQLLVAPSCTPSNRHFRAKSWRLVGGDEGDSRGQIFASR
jgi:hypothetical protein